MYFLEILQPYCKISEIIPRIDFRRRIEKALDRRPIIALLGE
jgi:hypothetical protein